jgi:hypothetical protein
MSYYNNYNYPPMYYQQPPPGNRALSNALTGTLYGVGIGALTGNVGRGAGIGALTGLALGPSFGSMGVPGFRGGKKRSRSKSPKRKSPTKRRKLNSGKKYSPKRKSRSRKY